MPSELPDKVQRWTAKRRAADSPLPIHSISGLPAPPSEALQMR